MVDFTINFIVNQSSQQRIIYWVGNFLQFEYSKIIDHSNQRKQSLNI